MDVHTTGILAAFVTGTANGIWWGMLWYRGKVEHWRSWALHWEARAERIPGEVPSLDISVNLKSVLESVGMALLVAVLWIPIKVFGLFKGGDEDWYYD